mmetsp:Transcript_28134/g.77472  ORF Transcript_28134/g.77472 Transcript_28134/m.77472 type:complete len:230 (+) Transcript_28134:375-1064(+)
MRFAPKVQVHCYRHPCSELPHDLICRCHLVVVACQDIPHGWLFGEIPERCEPVVSVAVASAAGIRHVAEQLDGAPAHRLHLYSRPRQLQQSELQLILTGGCNAVADAQTVVEDGRPRAELQHLALGACVLADIAKKLGNGHVGGNTILREDHVSAHRAHHNTCKRNSGHVPLSLQQRLGHTLSDCPCLLHVMIWRFLRLAPAGDCCPRTNAKVGKGAQPIVHAQAPRHH